MRLFSQRKKRTPQIHEMPVPSSRFAVLSLYIRHAVCALIHRRVGLVRAYRDAVERTVLRACAVVGALVNRAADCLVAMGFIHEKDLLF